MQVGNVAFSLSPEAQRAAEQKLSTQAIDSFRQQAQASAQAFGYSGYSIREVNVNHDGSSLPRPIMMMQARGDERRREDGCAHGRSKRERRR